MDYKIALYCLIAFVGGRLSTLKVYVGPDEDKYKAADFAIKLRQK